MHIVLPCPDAKESFARSCTGTARQMMRSAAGQDRQEAEMDDFARDTGGRMLIKVRRASHRAGTVSV